MFHTNSVHLSQENTPGEHLTGKGVRGRGIMMGVDTRDKGLREDFCTPIAGLEM